MRLFKKCLIAILTVATLSGCTSPQTFVDPRTLVFPPLKFDLPKSERVQLENGMVVYLLEDHDFPLVNVTAYIKTGSIYEPSAKAGLAGITGTVIRSGGTRALAPEQLDAELEFMASSVESSIGSDVGNVSLATLTKNLDRTLELFGQVLMYPAFREDRVTLIQNMAIESIRRENDDPKDVANRELQKTLYKGHPLGRVPTIETVKGITRDDLVQFHRRFYHPGAVMLAVAGDFNRDELLDKLRALFSGWNTTPTDLPSVSKPNPKVLPQVLLARKEINQSVIRMGHLGIDKENPDLYAIRVMNFILGGGFTSRLMTEIRTNQGLAYNVGSRFNIGRSFVGTFIAMTETKAQSTAKAINLMQDIIKSITMAPVTDIELKLAKESIINSFMFGFAKPNAVVNQQLRLEYFGYPAEYLENYRDKIAHVNKEDILRVAKKYLHPDALVLTVVGDDQKFDQPLSSFGKVKKIKLNNNK